MNSVKISRWGAWVGCALGITFGLVACEKKTARSEPTGTAEIDKTLVPGREGELLQAGTVQADSGIPTSYFYYAPDPAVDPKEALRIAIEHTMKGVPVVASDEGAPPPPYIILMEEKAPLKQFAPPDEGYFKHSGRGLTPEDIKAIQGTKAATAVGLVAPREDVWKLGQAFNELCLEFANQTNAFIWDYSTREGFSRDAWKTTRIDGWSVGELPDLRRQISMHLYPREDGTGKLRLITLGMEKFGLPDVVVDELIPGNTEDLRTLVGVVCQQLAMDPVIADPGKYPIDLATLRPAKMSRDLQSLVIRGGTGKGLLALVLGEPDEGDPDNRLLELDFRHGAGTDPDERAAFSLAILWGKKGRVFGIRPNEEIEAASREARKGLAKWKGRFQAGLPLSTRLLVKAPFPRDDEGNEFMWFEVLRWDDDDTLHGALQNQPKLIKELKPGSKVKVKRADAFDYLIYHPDGTTEGNTTGKLLEKQTGPVSEE